MIYEAAEDVLGTGELEPEGRHRASYFADGRARSAHAAPPGPWTGQGSPHLLVDL